VCVTIQKGTLIKNYTPRTPSNTVLEFIPIHVEVSNA